MLPLAAICWHDGAGLAEREVLGPTVKLRKGTSYMRDSKNMKHKGNTYKKHSEDWNC